MTKNIDDGRVFLKSLNIDYPRCGYYIGAGWTPFVHAALRALVEAGWDGRLAQVKQKFCGLRIYLDGESTPTLEGIILQAERACAIACESCGNPHGLTIPCGWLALCSKCQENPST